MSWLLRRAAPSLLPSLGDKVQASCPSTPPHSWVVVLVYQHFTETATPPCAHGGWFDRATQRCVRDIATCIILLPFPHAHFLRSLSVNSLNRDPITGCWSRLRQYYASSQSRCPDQGSAHSNHTVYFGSSRVAPLTTPTFVELVDNPAYEISPPPFPNRPVFDSQHNLQAGSNITKLQLQAWSILRRRSPS